MKLEELISGKNGQEEVNLEGVSIPASALKRLMDEGYLRVRSYKENSTFFLWGKTCSACLTKEEIFKRAGIS
jgi:hypothetical protein